ncbi:AI-2E family transporter [Costertonia aggregata]|uniref:AI-2E family transporter n=1 Tax=Costertonia aggregata TaxID=343403 RepID=A0A7H9ASL9_9FLAO|nr:AI-2E family transporter [Costertonia aggregata]QLG46481.1 AI-2E family transporter [Costertonia aggregata]
MPDKIPNKPFTDPFTKKIVQSIGIAIVTILLTLLFLKGFRVILLILGGILVAAFFLGIADFIRSKTPLSRNLSLLISVLLIVGLTSGISFALAPRISEQTSSLREQLPQAADETLNKLESTEVGSMLISQFESLDMNPKKSEITNFFGSLFEVLSTIYIILFLGIFFMVAPEKYLKGIVSLFPKRKRARTKEILITMGTTLKSWLLGKLLSMLIVGVLTGIGLSILGVPLALTLALFAALISFIPNFGPLLALIPAFLLAFTVDSMTALYVVILYFGIQAIESNVFTPMIQRKMISFPMAMVLIAQVVLGLFTGILGVILAVPLVAVIMVLVKMAYIEDVLGDDSVSVKEN